MLTKTTDSSELEIEIPAISIADMIKNYDTYFKDSAYIFLGDGYKKESGQAGKYLIKKYPDKLVTSFVSPWRLCSAREIVWLHISSQLETFRIGDKIITDSYVHWTSHIHTKFLAVCICLSGGLISFETCYPTAEERVTKALWIQRDVWKS